MPAPRLTDSQKQELVARYRQGDTAQALAEAYGCSPNTVSRVVKAALSPEEMAASRKQGRSAKAEPVVEVAVTEPAAEEPDPADDDAGVLAIDDADEFGDDDDDFADDGLDDDEADLEAELADPAPAFSLPQGERPQTKPLQPGLLPSSVYMLVDKTVELQAKPLREFPELGALPEEELELQALMLFTNPRQAKRQCGRSQRVIKVPDSEVLQRRSSYLVAQGITRLVIEGGALYSLPGV
ncbi:MAG: hypothetical protein EB126_07735 [Synechococcaceae bacterium WBB_10_009]|nr:hypothetical protein [Synechococcaceae bacterium WBB_10_009]